MNLPAEFFRGGGFRENLEDFRGLVGLYRLFRFDDVKEEWEAAGWEVLVFRYVLPTDRQVLAGCAQGQRVLRFPSANDFGRFGWFFMGGGNAVAKYGEIIRK